MSETVPPMCREAAPELTDLCIDELRAAMLTERVKTRDVIAAFAAQAKHVDDATRCWVSKTPAVEDVWAESPMANIVPSLAGVPFGHKDVFSDGGVAPRAGSTFDDLHVGEGVAPVLKALRDAGAVAMGKLALDELCYGATGVNTHRGPVRNPWNVSRIAGGSSCGAAAAVAGRAVAFSIGTDTGGSVRIPASLCGVVGLKPTFGSVDTRGMVPLSPSQDTVGVMARRADDCARVLAVIRRPMPGGDDFEWPHRPASLEFVKALAEAACEFERSSENREVSAERPLRGVRIAVARHPYFDVGETELSARVTAALRVFERLGATLNALPIDGIEVYDADATALTSYEAYGIHRERLLNTPDRLSTATRLRLVAASRVDPSDYARALAARVPGLHRFVSHVFREHDVLVCPSVTVRAKPIAALVGQSEEAVAFTSSLLRTNRCFNYLGLPALSLPMGFDDDGMPVGLQLVGRPWAEFELLRYAEAYQRETAWHRARPGLASR
ncbi:amidase [Pararobbsia silviterrae]|uniref:Amidase n=1 Tax=Pararobbsia silviterrae TaxID=1792498 RepID=A0A494XTX3_9BURK|nr:amidase [Pararobbsia silviterrae]RKP53272.1 amidase [Pararobbsia silviterrae]